jgi:NADH-quinone oxidoreductase subunit C
MTDQAQGNGVGTDEGTGGDGAGAPELMHGVPVTSSRGQAVLHPSREEYLDLVRRLRDDEGYHLCSDLVAVDYLTNTQRSLPAGVAPERFEVAVVLRSMSPASMLRIRVQVPARDARLPSLFGLFPGTENLEREAYDLVGIRFDDHPDLTRILMPDDWEGHPLRKDEPVGRIPVQFKGAPQPR